MNTKQQKMKRLAATRTTEATANEKPTYFRADVPEHVRPRTLDLCFRRLYHDALELLRQYRFTTYTQDDLINFYH